MGIIMLQCDLCYFSSSPFLFFWIILLRLTVKHSSLCFDSNNNDLNAAYGIDATSNEAQGIMMHYELRLVMEFSLEYVDKLFSMSKINKTHFGSLKTCQCMRHIQMIH